MFKSGFKIITISFISILLFASNAFAFESVEFAIKEICAHMQGNLGGLLMTTAGVGGLVAAAFGNLRASHSLIVTGVGAVTISALMSLYFPDAAKLCEGAAPGGGGPARQFAAAPLEKVAADENLLQRKTFEDALTVANGQDAVVNNNVELQATDDEDEFDPGANEFADGF